MAGASKVPVPDPTVLTTEALRRDIGALAQLLDEKLARVEASIAAMQILYDRVLEERDRRIAERFLAAEDAVDTAMSAAREATGLAVASQERAVSAAFEASERAITKAEVSIEKRADATYVALGELQRMLSDLMPRVEAEQRFGDLLERAQSNGTRITQLESQKIGAKEDRTGLYATIGIGLTILLAVLSVVGFLAARGGP